CRIREVQVVAVNRRVGLDVTPVWCGGELPFLHQRTNGVRFDLLLRGLVTRIREVCPGARPVGRQGIGRNERKSSQRCVEQTYSCGSHVCPFHAEECRPLSRRETLRSELGRQVAVDLEADTDFSEHWAGPGHRSSPLMFRALQVADGTWRAATSVRRRLKCCVSQDDADASARMRRSTMRAAPGGLSP